MTDLNDALCASPDFTPVRLRGRYGDPLPRVQQWVDKVLAGRAAPKVLEAGCGSLTRLRLPADRHLVGIDIAPRQLARHTGLDETVLGDLQTHRWQGPGFDLIVCWDVIEHLPDPAAALDRMATALRPGGALVLAFPNLWSLKGLVTKLTPFGVHVFFYRYVIGDKRRTDEWDQFPTCLRPAIAPPRLRAWARQQGLVTLHDELYEGPVPSSMRERSRFFDLGFAGLSLVSRTLTLGRLDLGLSDGVMVLSRPSPGVDRPPARDRAARAQA